VVKADYANVIKINKATGLFKVGDTKNALKWYIYLFATGKDGVDSGKSSVPNVYLHLYDPPPAKVYPPEFIFINKKPVLNSDKELIIETKLNTYDDRKYWKEPERYTFKRYFTMFLPGTFDA
jgi:hypothetical protein